MIDAANAVQAIIDAGRRSDAAHDRRRQIENIILAGDVDTVVLGKPCRITVTLDFPDGEPGCLEQMREWSKEQLRAAGVVVR